MTQRTDPSSISFGRLLRQTVDVVNRQQAEIAELRQGQLSSAEKQQVQLAATERQAEQNRALQLLASSSTSPEDFQNLNQSMLTVAQREQVRLELNSQQGANLVPLQPFSPEAALRIRNWQQSSPQNRDGFSQTARRQFSPEPPTRFERWQANQERPETKQHNEKMRLQAEEIRMQNRYLNQQLEAPRSGGIDFNNPRSPQ